PFLSDLLGGLLYLVYFFVVADLLLQELQDLVPMLHIDLKLLRFFASRMTAPCWPIDHLVRLPRNARRVSDSRKRGRPLSSAPQCFSSLRGLSPLRRLNRISDPAIQPVLTPFHAIAPVRRR